MGMAAILFNGAEPFIQIVNNPSTEGRLPVKSDKNLSSSVRKEDF